MGGLSRWLVVSLCILGVGCASSPQKEVPQIQRISAAQLDKLLPKSDPNLTYEELVRLSREKTTPDDLIEKIRQSHSTYDLTPAEAIDLHQRGVDTKVLDYIHAARDQGLRDGFAEELNKREREHQAEIKKLEQALQLRPYYYDPFWGPYPPYWRYPYTRRR